VNQELKMQNIYYPRLSDWAGSKPTRPVWLVDASQPRRLLRSGLAHKALNKGLKENLACLADDIPTYLVNP
jgi:hypothetical protein